MRSHGSVGEIQCHSRSGSDANGNGAMSGIINYYHGEKGVVADRWWGLFEAEERLEFNIELGGDPHRRWAHDYNADIGIDPSITRGDTAVYLRLEDVCGIWVREGEEQGDALSRAIGRVHDNRRWMREWQQHRDDEPALVGLAKDVLHETGEPLRVVSGHPTAPGPPTPVSFFLSYSSRDSLVARQVYEDLSKDANVQVWFDLAHSRSFPAGHDDAIVTWLEDSVRQSQGFVLLLTAASLQSDWVNREIDFAVAKGIGRADSHILILKAADVAVPERARSAAKVIDCDGMWWSRGISEELFAAIYGREGRKSWLARESATPASKGETLSYGDFAAEAGTVVSFTWNTSPCPGSDFRRKDLSWLLEYKKPSGKKVKVAGGGEDKPADLDMRPNDRIAVATLHSRWGTQLRRGLPLWMRSDDLKVCANTVLDRYFEALEVNFGCSPAIRRFRKMGVDAWGRVTAIPSWICSDGQSRTLESFYWAMLRKGVDSRNLLEQLSRVKSTELIGWE